MDTIGSDVTEQIISEIGQLLSIMQQNIIDNEFNCEYAPLTNIQQSMAIEFLVKGANDLYLNLNNSRLHLLAKSHQSGRNKHRREHSGSNQPDVVSMFREIGLELNSQYLGDKSQLYAYRLNMERPLNFCKKNQ